MIIPLETHRDPPEPKTHPTSPHTYPLTFTGQAAEYWRIWMVNLTLCVLTLGLYSPWAKLRKMRWFARHTEMMGDTFDYQANPFRLLLGRLIALVLLLLYGHAFQFSKWAGLSFVVTMLVISPLLFASAQRFKLRASSWRGLHFDFHVNAKTCYAGCLPILLIWLGPWAALHLVSVGGWYLSLIALPWLALPWAHARLKAMQHRHSSFLGRSFGFGSVTQSFYFNYLFLIGLALGSALAVGAGAALAIGWIGIGEGFPVKLTMGLVSAVVYLLIWPMFAARQQKMVWDNTQWDAVRFTCDIDAKRAWRLVLTHGPLVLLSAGLWWPVAAVAWARLRVEAICLTSELDLNDVLQRVHPGQSDVNDPTAVTGDATVDMFGLDLGW